MSKPWLLVNKSLARGEVSPFLYARPEVEDFPYSGRLVRNFIITKEGVAQSRPGTRFIDECRLPGTYKKLIPFIFSTSSGDTYMIELGHLYMEFVRAGGRVLESSISITAISKSNPCVVTFGSAHSLTAGDHVFVQSVGGMTEVGGRYQAQTPSATTISLYDMNGNAIDSTNFTTWTSGGTVARVYKIATPYDADDIDTVTVKYTQSADVMYLTHPSYSRRKLSRTGHTTWTLAEVAEGPSLSGPTALAVTAGGSGGGLTYEYAVTSISASGEESYQGVEGAIAISAITAANPPVVTTATHSYTSGQQVLLSGISGMTELNGRRFVVKVLSATTFSLVGVDASSYTAYTSGGSSFRTSDIITNANAPTAAAPHVLTWTAATGAVKYGIYRKLHGYFGFVGFSESETFSDPNVTPNTNTGPPEYQEEFLFAGDFPGAVTIHQQRTAYAGSTNEADSIKMSVTGGYEDFSTHTPVRDSDKVEFTLASTEINRIIHLVSLRRLIALSGSSEWSIEGDSAGTLTPSAINARQYTLHGSSHVRPVIVDNDLLYVQARGSTIRSFYFDWERDSYSSQDVTIKASHLFRNYSITDMAYAKIPDSILWVVRNDGKLLSLTYNPEVRVLAWTQHVIGGSGLVKSVATIPENDDAQVGGEDAVYILTEREIDGETVTHLERIQGKVIDQDARDRYTWLGPDFQEEVTSLDSFKTYDERNTGAATIALSGANYSAGQPLTATASAAGTFLESDIGTESTSRKFVLWTSAGSPVSCTVTAYSGSTSVTVQADVDVPASLQNTSTTLWAPAVRRVTGLRHLEGKSISALGDGFVAANANLSGQGVTVTDHAAVFSNFYTVIHAGLPIVSDVRLHDVEPPEGASWYGKKKKVSAVGVYVKDSTSFYAGVEFPEEDEEYEGSDLTYGLERAEERDLDEEDTNLPTPLRTEYVHVGINTEPTAHGRAVIRHLEPKRLVILAAVRTLEVAD